MSCFERKKFPLVKKCCFCVPLRKGVIIFGYVNLILSLLCVPVLIFMVVEDATSIKPAEEKDYIHPLIYLSFTLAIVIFDVAITTVLIIGAHKKKKILLKIYFYSGLVLLVLTLFIELVNIKHNSHLENVLTFLGFGLNIYLLFLVFNTIHLIEENRQVQYIAHLNQHF